MPASRQPENWVALIRAVEACAATCGGGGVILSSRRFVPGRLFDRSRHFRSQNAARPGERFKCLPRRLVITFAGQGSAACIDSGLVHGTAPSGRPIIQQLKGFPGASNSMRESESNEDRDWPGELSAVHDNLQSELKDGGKEYAWGARQRASRPLVAAPSCECWIMCVGRAFIRIRQDASLLAAARNACRVWSGGCTSLTAAIQASGTDFRARRQYSVVQVRLFTERGWRSVFLDEIPSASDHR
jgi:hypothetical protein